MDYYRVLAIKKNYLHLRVERKEVSINGTVQVLIEIAVRGDDAVRCDHMREELNRVEIIQAPNALHNLPVVVSTDALYSTGVRSTRYELRSLKTGSKKP